jgi:hypothetical protein
MRGMPVSAWLPHEPAVYSFHTECGRAPAARSASSQRRHSGSAPGGGRRAVSPPIAAAAGHAQNGPPRGHASRSRAFNAAASSNRLLRFSWSRSSRARSSQTPRGPPRESSSASSTGYPSGKSQPTSTRSCLAQNPRSRARSASSASARVAQFCGALSRRPVPRAAPAAIQMLSAPSVGTFAALQSTKTYASNRRGWAVACIETVARAKAKSLSFRIRGPTWR